MERETKVKQEKVERKAGKEGATNRQTDVMDIPTTTTGARAGRTRSYGQGREVGVGAPSQRRNSVPSRGQNREGKKRQKLNSFLRKTKKDNLFFICNVVLPSLGQAVPKVLCERVFEGKLL